MLRDEEQKDLAETREQIRAALGRQRLQTLADWQHAVDTNDCHKLRRLIASGVDPNLRNYDGRTALHIACAKGHCQVPEPSTRINSKLLTL
jgi:ankyrin repeat protein